MRTNEEIEAFLLQMGRDFTSAGEGVWVIHDEYEHIENIVVCNAPPVITFRLKLMQLPANGKREELYDQLLRLNAGEMVAGAYGIEDDSIVIVDTLQTENLDMNELQASIDGLTLAISMHYPLLRKFHQEDEIDEAESEALAAFDAQLSKA
jgi:hypothetical protein